MQNQKASLYSSVLGFPRNRVVAILTASMLLAVAVSSLGAAEDKSSVSGSAGAWDQVPGILKRIVPPVFPDRSFNVKDYGAEGDGATDCTDAFRKAIEACHEGGGGIVLVPDGTYLTGAIHLKSHVNLRLSAGAVIRFSTDPQKYLPVVFTRFECTEVMNYSGLIYAMDQVNIAITGSGTLDGQGDAWWGWKGSKSSGDIKALVDMGNRSVPVEQRVFGDGHFLRPNLLQPVRCTNVLIEGIKVMNSPMWTIHPVYCQNVTIRQVTAEGSGPNTDGCDPDSCRDVLIRDCVFSNGDDCIAIKSGRDADGHRVHIPCENVVIQGCVFKNGHGGVTLGSETAGDIRTVFAEDCAFNSPNLDMALRFKTGPARGGTVENVYIRNCKIPAAKVGIHMTMKYDVKGSYTPVIRRVDIRDCVFVDVRRAIFIEGLSESVKIADVTIANCRFEKAQETNAINNAENLRLLNCFLNGKIME
jgi:polygalacturonase